MVIVNESQSQQMPNEAFKWPRQIFGFSQMLLMPSTGESGRFRGVCRLRLI